ncbi:MAG: transcriptional regulator [Bacteroidota bacterium]
MEYSEAKAELISFWGVIGTAWGINKTMSQIYAILLVSDRSLSIEEIMRELNISRGNASMNIRNLMGWGLAFKEVRPGERKEYFSGEKDLWAMARKVASERRKREIEPLLSKLEDLQDLDSLETAESEEFSKMVLELHELIGTFDKALQKFIGTNNKLAIKSFQKILSLT